ncbi:MAG: FAD binding domain-containing protein [Candidatus Omnitrophota bacterium]
MNRFQYASAASAKEAVSLLDKDFGKTKILAGGLDLVGELKQYIIEPETVVNISDIKELNYIEPENGGLKIGALTTLMQIAQSEPIRSHHAALAQAASMVGSPQIRHIGTLGGNLCQRPRCWYYRDETYPCLKKSGEICFSVAGRNRYHAILGGSPCFIVHPSDCATALIALGASIRLLGPDGPRELPLEEFFTLPEVEVTRENVLHPQEIITEAVIPAHKMKSVFLKFKEKDSFDWAVATVAAALELEGGRRCVKANIILGAAAPIPWRAKKAEALLAGQTISEELAEKAGAAAVADAEPLEENQYKVSLLKALVKQSILQIAG